MYMPVSRDMTGSADVHRFERFVQEYQHMVFAVAVRLLANQADAEDVAQTVFLRAFERFDEVVDHPAVAGWLRTVTTNLCLNHLERYRKRWRLFSEMGDARPDPPDARTDGARADAAIDESRRQTQLETALGRLPAHQRVPIVLFHFEQQSYADIARALGVSEGKVKTDMHRGRLRLREALR
jgi:RNA polymerase sigma-70 factor, ECF subfamily